LKIIILGGFLGSGKTSFLIQLARFLAKNGKVAIIENEIGEAGIDDKVLRGSGYNVSNLFAGCVCCSLTGELIASIKNMKENMNPEWLIIEATGVAYPGSIRKSILEELESDSFILTVADAKRWNRLVNAMETLVSGQLEDSNLILLNKVDLVTAIELKLVKESILNFNKDLEIVTISAIQDIDQYVFEYINIKMGGL